MRTTTSRFVVLCTLALTVALGGRPAARADAPTTYTLGGVSCAATPSSGPFYCFDGFGFSGYRASLSEPANFAPGGIVPVTMNTVAVSSFSAGDLAGVDGLVVPWWSIGDAGANADLVKSYFLAGGDLFILADNPFNDPVNAALGVPTASADGVASRSTSGAAPLHAGPFGAATTVNQYFAVGALDPADVTFHGGHAVGFTTDGRITAAVWDKNEYAPGSGRMIIATDVDSMVSSLDAVYEPPSSRNDNGRFALNATAFLVNGGTVDGAVYDFIGVPSCSITPGGGNYYCGRNGVLYLVRQNASLISNFGPGGTIDRRVAFVEFTSLTPALLGRLKAVVIPWVEDANALPYKNDLRDYFLQGGNLWLLQDDFFHDPIGELLGIPTPTAIGVPIRPTNGTAPIYDGPFGAATDVGQAFTVGSLDASQVSAHGGTIVGTATNGDNVVAVWHENQYAAGAGRMVIATDVDALAMGFIDPSFATSNLTWSLNTVAFLIGSDSTPPVISCATATSSLWPPNGRTEPVAIVGTIADGGSGVAPASLTYAVVDEYGQVQPFGTGTIAGGALSAAVPLEASRRGNDRDGRTYTITLSAQDLAGNVGTCSVVVTVPHDQRP